MDFDLRFIYQRSIVCGVRSSVDLSFARYRSNPIYDTMKEWVKWSNTNVGLEHLALALGIPTPKEGIDGSQVFDFYKAGKQSEIVEYCKRELRPVAWMRRGSIPASLIEQATTPAGRLRHQPDPLLDATIRRAGDGLLPHLRALTHADKQHPALPDTA